MYWILEREKKKLEDEPEKYGYEQKVTCPEGEFAHSHTPNNSCYRFIKKKKQFLFPNFFFGFW